MISSPEEAIPVLKRWKTERGELSVMFSGASHGFHGAANPTRGGRVRESALSAADRGRSTTDVLIRYYQQMLRRLGPQEWWPARSRLGVILGAILTQNTSWTNVELAMRRLRHVRLLSLRKLRQATRTEIEAAIRPAGFYRQKAATIQTFITWLDRSYHGSLAALFVRPPQDLRR